MQNWLLLKRCDHLGPRKTRTLSPVAHFHTRYIEGPTEPGCLGAADQTALHGPQSPASLGDTEQRHYSTRGHVLTRHPQEDRGKKSSSHLDWRWGFTEAAFLHILSPNKASLCMGSVGGKAKTHRRNRRWTAKEALERRKSKYQKPQDK